MYLHGVKICLFSYKYLTDPAPFRKNHAFLTKCCGVCYSQGVIICRPVSRLSTDSICNFLSSYPYHADKILYLIVKSSNFMFLNIALAIPGLLGLFRYTFSFFAYLMIFNWKIEISIPCSNFINGIWGLLQWLLFGDDILDTTPTTWSRKGKGQWGWVKIKLFFLWETLQKGLENHL